MKGQLGRPSHRQEGNIKFDLKQIGCEYLYWIQLAHNRILAGSCEQFNELSGISRPAQRLLAAQNSTAPSNSFGLTTDNLGSTDQLVHFI